MTKAEAGYQNNVCTVESRMCYYCTSMVYSETSLNWTPSIPDSFNTVLFVYRTPFIPDSLYTGLLLYWTLCLADFTFYNGLPVY